jgi:sucrose-6-phosphate hydrolase SacC (GH32 family)
MRRLHAEGRLTAAQAKILAPNRPLEELYDLETDPMELENLALQPEHAATLRSLREELAAWQERTGGPTPPENAEVYAIETGSGHVEGGKVHQNPEYLANVALMNRWRSEKPFAPFPDPGWLQPPPEELVLNYHLMHPGGESMPGDPNAAFALDGKYHLHYILAHPWQGRTSFSFVHVTSQDLLHWTWQPTKLQPAFTGHGMFSGTGFMTREGRPAAIYHGEGSGQNQIAVAEDHALSAWEKPYPVDVRRSDSSPASLRMWDPDCFTIGEWYYAISGGENPPLMKSKDLRQWTLVGDFLAHDLPDVAIGEDISCPNFFPIGDGKWMLLCISHSLGCRYYLGTWDSEREQFVPERHGRMAWRRDTQPPLGLFQRTDFFAPESVLTPDGRRILWAWLTSVGTHGEFLRRTIQSLPRELSLHDDGALRIEPARELESLRYESRQSQNLRLEHPVTNHAGPIPPKESVFLHRLGTCDSEAWEMRLRMDRSEIDRKLLGWMLFSDGAGAGLPILLRPDSGTLRVGDNEAPFSVADLPPGEGLDLRIFGDKYLVEVFVNGRQALVVAYTGPRLGLGFDAFAFGAPTSIRSVEFWKLRPTHQGFYEAVQSRVWQPVTGD